MVCIVGKPSGPGLLAALRLRQLVISSFSFSNFFLWKAQLEGF